MRAAEPDFLRRDAYGIPTVTARDLPGVWRAMGYAAGRDRLWQLEYDRRRATGTAAEVLGPEAVAGDVLALRLDLPAAARADVAAMSADTTTAFATYADGINAAAADHPLPPEFAEAGIGFPAWEPWHSVAMFKIRHVLMGEWLPKLTRLMLLVRGGVTAFTALDPPARPGMLLTAPARQRLGHAPPDVDVRDRLDALRAALAFLADSSPGAGSASAGHAAGIDGPSLDGGSNVWALAGSRTHTGRPLLVNDSHRAVDVPNAYWQVRLRCPELPHRAPARYGTVAGATFPGLPGFPHFGTNLHVGWAITHGTADTQDLVLEEFHAPGRGGPVRARTRSGHEPVRVRHASVAVRDAGPVDVECWTTSTGPVVHGGPETDDTETGTGSPYGLSLRWTALTEPCRQFEVLAPMLSARTVPELLDSQRGWVDPVNNLVCADTAGSIGYLLRGAVPERADPRSCQIPLPAWEDPGWAGWVPFERWPREVNPPGGVIVNGNNLTVDPGVLPVVRGFTEAYRVERVLGLLGDREDATADDMQALQLDRVSLAAREWIGWLRGQGPYRGEAERARTTLLEWDGDLAAGGPAPLVYGCFRRCLALGLLGTVVPTDLLDDLAALPALDTLLRRHLGSLIWPDADGRRAADGLDDVVVLTALTDAWQVAGDLGGSDPRTWSWPAAHPLAPRHLLAPRLPSPTPTAVPGDPETVAAAAYPMTTDRGRFDTTLSSVYRQVLDLADPTASRWVIPGGASGDPSSEHYQDQLRLWAIDALAPMFPDEVRDLDDGAGGGGRGGT